MQTWETYMEHQWSPKQESAHDVTDNNAEAGGKVLCQIIRVRNAHGDNEAAKGLQTDCQPDPRVVSRKESVL